LFFENGTHFHDGLGREVRSPSYPVLSIFEDVTSHKPNIRVSAWEDTHCPGSTSNFFVESLKAVGRADLPLVKEREVKELKAVFQPIQKTLNGFRARRIPSLNRRLLLFSIFFPLIKQAKLS
jgi:hypothetical protein